MMLEHEDIIKMHDAAYQRGQVTRERAADDLVFAWVTQWDDQLLGESQLQYRGEFNILRKAMRQIISDLKSNPVQIDFEPVGDNYNAADMMDGIYRTSTRKNTSLESFGNAIQEAVVSGFGAWKLENDYENRTQLQTINRIPLYEACNTVYWDPSASLLDKAGAKYCSILTRYSEEGYRDFVEELTGERPTTTVSFKYPEESYVFPWVAEDKRIYVGEFFHREPVTYQVHVFTDMMGNRKEVHDDDFEEEEGPMIDQGFEYSECIEFETYEVTKYIVSGQEILETTLVPGEFIPVVPAYGERAFVEGEEHYEGITRLSKDPQRLRNFQMSYLADIVSRSPRKKPIFTPEQIQGYEQMYNEQGSDNNFPYLLQNGTSITGKQIPLGPVGEMPEQPMPQALIASLDLSRQAVEDVANPGLPQNIADPDLSGKAVLALQNRMDMQSFIYQDNHKHALRRDAEIFASMAKEVYDSPRKTTLTMYDGTRKTEHLMQQVIDPQQMQLQTINDISGIEMEVYAEIGTNFKTEQMETRTELKEMINGLPPGDPIRNILMLEYIAMMPGMAFESLRDYGKRELLKMGIRQPETEEEMQFLQQLQQQPPQPDPQMIAAQAEQGKAQAEQMSAEVKMYDAQTKRAKVEIEASKAGVEIESLQEDIAGKRLANMSQLAATLRPAPIHPMRAVS